MKRNGFTLIELMIVLAVIGILAAVAMPSYTSYLARGKIIDAVAALADYRVKMEQYFQDNRNYGTASASCPVVVADSKYFTYTCLVGSATPTVTYTATATSIAGALGRATGDYTYTVDQANAKSTTKFKGTSYSAGTKNCWLIRGDEC
ncbi:MAG: type IV pilin protein [Burkholderiaceae bacterium]|nr:type IV pilin protein [Burkholderiaceae bacterium]